MAGSGPAVSPLTTCCDSVLMMVERPTAERRSGCDDSTRVLLADGIGEPMSMCYVAVSVVTCSSSGKIGGQNRC